MRQKRHDILFRVIAEACSGITSTRQVHVHVVQGSCFLDGGGFEFAGGGVTASTRFWPVHTMKAKKFTRMN